MCECEYDEDYDINLYTTRELTAMLGFFSGKCWTIPPFSRDEIETELKTRQLKENK